MEHGCGIQQLSHDRCYRSHTTQWPAALVSSQSSESSVPPIGASTSPEPTYKSDISSSDETTRDSHMIVLVNIEGK